MPKHKRTEAEVAAVVMEAMQEQGWNCYPEVLLPYGGRADIVGVRPFPFLPNRPCVHIVECKTSWTLSLLEQACQRISFAHYVTIAAPTKASFFYERLCRERGIGMLRFDNAADLRINKYIALEARLVRRKEYVGFGGPARLMDILDEDMKNYAPGTQASEGYSTPFKRTMDRAEAYVRENPGATVKDIVQAVDHHYASIGGFKQGILNWLWRRDGIEARKEGNCMRFYPEGESSIQPELITDC